MSVSEMLSPDWLACNPETQQRYRNLVGQFDRAMREIYPRTWERANKITGNSDAVELWAQAFFLRKVDQELLRMVVEYFTDGRGPKAPPKLAVFFEVIRPVLVRRREQQAIERDRREQAELARLRAERRAQVDYPSRCQEAVTPPVGPSSLPEEFQLAPPTPDERAAGEAAIGQMLAMLGAEPAS